MTSWDPENLVGVDLQPRKKRGPRKPRTINASLPAYYSSPAYAAEALRQRYQWTQDAIASGDLRQIAARGQFLSEGLKEAVCPNLYAHMIEELRDAYTFFATGALPAERS